MVGVKGSSDLHGDFWKVNREDGGGKSFLLTS